MNHSFDIEMAKKYGVDEAIILENMIFWIAKNKANGKHFYDGHYWTYNSVKAFKELFPYWTERQIDRILKSLESKGAIKAANYNSSSYDRTKWFAVTMSDTNIIPNGEMSDTTISPNGEMDLHETRNGFTENVKPIPDNKPDNKPDINIYSPVEEKPIPFQEIIEYLNLKANTNYKYTIAATKDLITARWKGGYTLADFKTVIDKKCNEWLGNDFEKYLRPETLFKGSKFEGYLNQKIIINTKKVDKFNEFEQRPLDDKEAADLEKKLLGYD